MDTKLLLSSSNESVSETHAGPAVSILLIFLASIIVAAVAASGSVFRAVLISCIATLIIGPITYRVAMRSLSLFEPIIPSALAMLVMYVGRPISDQALESYLHLGYDISATFDWTLTTVFVGVLAFMIGYHAGYGNSLQKLYLSPPAIFPPRKLVFGALLMAILGATLFGIFIMANGGLRAMVIVLSGRSFEHSSMLRQSSAYLYFGIFLLLPATLIFYGLLEKTRDVRYLALTIVTGVPLFLYEASMGDRSEMLPLVFGLPTIHYLWKGKKPQLFRLIAGGLILLLFFAFLREFRNASITGQRQVQSVSMLSDPLKGLASTFTKDDSEMFDTFCNLVTVVPSELPFHPFGMIRDIAIRVLPRVLFPQKPLELPDQVVVILWPEHYKLSRASSASSILANFYLWGGIVAVAICAFFMGIFLRSVWIWYVAHQDNLNAILLYSFVPSLVVILWRGTVTDTLGRMFFTVLPMIILMRHIRSSTT